MGLKMETELNSVVGQVYGAVVKMPPPFFDRDLKGYFKRVLKEQGKHSDNEEEVLDAVRHVAEFRGIDLTEELRRI